MPSILTATWPAGPHRWEAEPVTAPDPARDIGSGSSSLSHAGRAGGPGRPAADLRIAVRDR